MIRVTSKHLCGSCMILFMQLADKGKEVDENSTTQQNI